MRALQIQPTPIIHLMKTCTTRILRPVACLAVMGISSAALSANVLLFDFGVGTGSTTPTLGGSWNVITANPVPASATGFVYTDGSAATGITLSFANFANTSTNQGVWPAGNKEWVDGAATVDYFWRGSGATASVTVSGLNTALTYDLELVSARADTGTAWARSPCRA
jgi:hypothetical protein